MKNISHLPYQMGLLSVLAMLLLAGCASDTSQGSSKPTSDTSTTRPEIKRYKDQTYAADPTKVKFSAFAAVELKTTTLDAAENTSGNQKSAKKIDEMLTNSLIAVWPNLKVIPAGADFSQGGPRTLQISPQITHIRIVGPATRIWIGAMGGGSDLVMHVDFRDSATGENVAHPDFWRGNNAWSGGTTMGAADNQIRDAVVAQIVSYIKGNQ